VVSIPESSQDRLEKHSSGRDAPGGAIRLYALSESDNEVKAAPVRADQ